MKLKYLVNFSGLFLENHSNVAHPYPDAMERCDSGTGKDERNSCVHLLSCHVYELLTSRISNLEKRFLSKCAYHEIHS